MYNLTRYICPGDRGRSRNTAALVHYHGGGRRVTGASHPPPPRGTGQPLLKTPGVGDRRDTDGSFRRTTNRRQERGSVPHRQSHGNRMDRKLVKWPNHSSAPLNIMV
ncbi:unnamed protein product [Nezara viridula]|uniref:Uncharacterized protein n=1 Tax=Nezara viridula TaxID=85310 RepID=A0A9P0HB50_NEZVI|nr:unnamed protein product [Nezara viridula]